MNYYNFNYNNKQNPQSERFNSNTTYEYDITKENLMLNKKFKNIQ